MRLFQLPRADASVSARGCFSFLVRMLQPLRAVASAFARGCFSPRVPLLWLPQAVALAPCAARVLFNRGHRGTAKYAIYREISRNLPFPSINREIRVFP